VPREEETRSKRGNSSHYLREAMSDAAWASTSRKRVDRAVMQKNPHLSAGVTASVALTYDRLDAKILEITAGN
jgi:hypothetical protein